MEIVQGLVGRSKGYEGRQGDGLLGGCLTRGSEMSGGDQGESKRDREREGGGEKGMEIQTKQSQHNFDVTKLIISLRLFQVTSAPKLKYKHIHRNLIWE
jgi:hypothetical protein